MFCPPDVAPVTSAEEVQEALATRNAPVSETLPDPAAAVMVPPPQLPVKPFGVDTTSPAGSVSAKPTPATAAAGFGFLMVKLRLVLPFSGTVAAPKAFVRFGGTAGAAGPVVVTMLLLLSPAGKGEPAMGVSAPVAALIV